MPVKSVKSIRTAMVGGFNRQDVSEYISTLVRDHKSEVEELRAERDKLQAERDAFSEQLVELSVQYGLAGQMEKLVQNLKNEVAELTREKERMQGKEDELVAEVGRLTILVQEYESAENELGEAKMRAEELEMQAYRRAEEIEAEAASNMEKLKSSTNTTLHELREKLGAMHLEADKSAENISAEMDRIRLRFESFGDVFKDTEEKIRELIGENKPIVHEFVPKTFDE